MPTNHMQLIVCTSLLIPIVGFTDDSSSGVCMPEITREVERQRAYVTRELEKFQRVLQQLDRDIVTMAATSAEPERLTASLRMIVEEAKPVDPLEEFVEQPAALLKDLYAAIEQRSFCPSDLKVSGYLQAFRDSFDRAILSPAYEVKLREEAEALPADEGLVIVSFWSNFPFADLMAKRVGAMGEIRVRPTRSGEHHVVIKASPGEYRWEQVRQGRVRLDLADENYTFSVKAGHINYVGMLDIRKVGKFGFNYPRMDRQAYVLTRVENKMPELLDRLPLHNGLEPENLYTRFYIEQRQVHAAN